METIILTLTTLMASFTVPGERCVQAAKMNEWKCEATIRCDVFQVVERREVTAEGRKCEAEWDAYAKSNADLCDKNGCAAVYIFRPTCQIKNRVIWTRQVAMCEDGVVRWRDEPGMRPRVERVETQ